MRPAVTRADGDPFTKTLNSSAAANAAAVGLLEYLFLSIFAVGRNSSQLLGNFLLTQNLYLMTQLRPNLLFSDMYGSAGAYTAYHRGGKCFLRKRVRSANNPGTSQGGAATVHLRALQAWRSLPHAEQLQWEPFAQDVEPHRPPFDHKARISGNNLFISAYHGFATLGNEHIPVPAPFEPFPSFLVSILGASAVEGTLYISFGLEVDDPGERYRLLTKIQLAAPGRGRHPGLMRNFLAVGEAGGARQIVSIPGYVDRWGLDLPSYQVHARCILLDTETGYRSQYLAVSGIISL